MLSIFSPIGILIYSLSLVACLVITISIVTRNRPRILSWQNRGLEDHIIASLFVRRIGLSTAIGAAVGSLIGCIISPVFYMLSYSDIIGVTFSGLGAEWLRPLAGTLFLTVSSAAAALITYNMTIKKMHTATATVTVTVTGEPASTEKTAPVKASKLDQLQESFLHTYTAKSEAQEQPPATDGADDLP